MIDGLFHTKKGLLYDRSTIEAQGPALPMNWVDDNTLQVNGGGSVVVVGFVRGASYENDNPVYRVSAPCISQISHSIMLPEWIYKLYVNGRRIMNPERYLKRKGVLL